MRRLILLRGAPGAGKSTWVEYYGLKPYTLCPDDIRLMYSSPSLDINGEYKISQNMNSKVFNTMFSILETRMENGDFTVIDATHAKTKDFHKYKNLAKKYRYRIYCVDFSDVSLGKLKINNANRGIKQVSEIVVEKIYNNLKTEKVPSGITIVDNKDALSIYKMLELKAIDVNHYNKITFIGDVHGCYKTLDKYWQENYNDNNLYVFLGDYIDRGPNNVDMIKFLLDNYNKSNVMLLEGNHEKHLWEYACGGTSVSREFNENTAKQLDKANVNKKELRMLCRKFITIAYLNYDREDNKNHILACHGGISNFKAKIAQLIPTLQLIKGVGSYSNSLEVMKSFNKHNSNIIQVHGHRNTNNSPLKEYENCYNLEDKVEQGGNLCILEIDKQHIECIKEQSIDVTQVKDMSIEKLVQEMRKHNFIKEKTFTDNISSFNFTSDAFYSKTFDDLSCKARGLFINTDTNKIVSRSYDKFFNYEEVAENTDEALKINITYPVSIYKKYNGYLGMLGYDEEIDSLVVSSKSSLDGEHAVKIVDILEEKLYCEEVCNIKEYLKKRNSTLVFEVIAPSFDEHIEDNSKLGDHLVLLDEIENVINFNPLDIEPEIVKIFKSKEVISTIYNYNDLINFIYNTLNSKVASEGVVIRDAKNRMFKVKTLWYRYWKDVRRIYEKLCKYKPKSEVAINKIVNKLYVNDYNYGNEDKVIEIMKQHYLDEIPLSVIQIRKLAE